MNKICMMQPTPSPFLKILLHADFPPCVGVKYHFVPETDTLSIINKKGVMVPVGSTKDIHSMKPDVQKYWKLVQEVNTLQSTCIFELEDNNYINPNVFLVTEIKELKLNRNPNFTFPLSSL